MKKDKTLFSASFSTFFLLFFVAVILKETGTIDWSWWWITCPLWIIPVFVIGVPIIIAIISLILILISIR